MQRADDWAELTDVEGFTPDFRVFVKAALVEGVIRIVGLKLIPRVHGKEVESEDGWVPNYDAQDRADDWVYSRTEPYPGADKWNAGLADNILSGQRLRGLPLADLAEHFAHRVPDEYQGTDTIPTDGRAGSTTAEAVASVYNAAGGITPRRAVEEQLGISARTAARYIAEARRKGLIPPANPRNNLRQKGSKKGDDQT